VRAALLLLLHALALVLALALVRGVLQVRLVRARASSELSEERLFEERGSWLLSMRVSVALSVARLERVSEATQKLPLHSHCDSLIRHIEAWHTPLCQPRLL